MSRSAQSEPDRKNGGMWRPRGLAKHPNPTKPRVGAWGKAVDIVWPTLADFVPRFEALRHALGGRAALATARNWALGRRRPPQWANQLMADELRKQIAARQHVLALLEADMEPKPDPLIGEVRNPT